MSRGDLAAPAGTRQEEVSRALRTLAHEGLVYYRSHDRVIGICDLEKLGKY
jgi:hypothetical protein